MDKIKLISKFLIILMVFNLSFFPELKAAVKSCWCSCDKNGDKKDDMWVSLPNSTMDCENNLKTMGYRSQCFGSKKDECQSYCKTCTDPEFSCGSGEECRNPNVIPGLFLCKSSGMEGLYVIHTKYIGNPCQDNFKNTAQANVCPICEPIEQPITD